MLQRTEGIVLRTNPYGEADLIVTYLTKDYGIVKTFAKSPRKIKSRFGSSLEPLTYSKISFWGKEDSALPRLTQADIIYPFHVLRSSLKSFLKVSEMIEITLSFVPERDPSPKAYSLLINMLRAFEEDSSDRMLVIYYKLKLLDVTGFLPKITGCGRCGNAGHDFYLSHGTVLCEKCSKGFETSFRISAGLVNFYKNLLEWNISHIKRIKPSDALVLELSMLIDEHIRYVTEKSLKTRAFRV
ncbi:MAG: DNA repair protein RecO [Nitrospirae bacterium GWC2_42_7]|nr:MAG: DNA repair protein RecO [Nitrospirae bacterium GWC2_42_7]